MPTPTDQYRVKRAAKAAFSTPKKRKLALGTPKVVRGPSMTGMSTTKRTDTASTRSYAGKPSAYDARRAYGIKRPFGH